MRMSCVACIFAIGLSLRGAPGRPTGQQPPVLPKESPLSEIDVRLDYELHGGCVGPCTRKYRVEVHGDGAVSYEVLDPIGQRQRRTIAVDQVVSLVNEFVRARFFEASASYDEEPVAVRQGHSVRFLLRGGSDGPEWDLRLRVGTQVKVVHLYRGFPTDLGRLRDMVDQIGGPKVWPAR